VTTLTINRPKHNTDGWGNKLVTIFARHLDNFILTIKFSILYKNCDFGSGQIQPSGQLSGSPGFAKIAPWRLVRQDPPAGGAKAPGQVTGRTYAANVYSLNRRAVRHK